MNGMERDSQRVREKEKISSVLGGKGERGVIGPAQLGQRVSWQPISVLSGERERGVFLRSEVFGLGGSKR